MCSLRMRRWISRLLGAVCLLTDRSVSVCFDEEVLRPGDDWHALLPRYESSSTPRGPTYHPNRHHSWPQRSAKQAQYSEAAVLHMARNRHSTRKTTRNVTQIDDRTCGASDPKRGGNPVIARVPPFSLRGAEGIRTPERLPLREDGSVSREAASQARLRQ
jgi:hypothetical protein